MADIKQAAKWLEEGKRVTRDVTKGNSWIERWFYDESTGTLVRLADAMGPLPEMMSTEDLLADDWEIAE